MVARIARFEGIDVAEAERTLDEVRSRVEPIMRGLDGFKGYLELVDRSGRSALTVAFFETEDALRAAEPTFEEEMPRQLADLFGQWAGRRTSVERYEVWADER
ncbi:MAG: hypothetical protein ABR521_10845 [Gaiellaceae bacterium]